MNGPPASLSRSETLLETADFRSSASAAQHDLAHSRKQFTSVAVTVHCGAELRGSGYAIRVRESERKRLAL